MSGNLRSQRLQKTTSLHVSHLLGGLIYLYLNYILTDVLTATFVEITKRKQLAFCQ